MASAAFHALSNRSGYATAIAPNAKGMFPEDAPHFIGCYWGVASSPGCAEIIESCDAYLFAGPVFNDYTTAGWSCAIDRAKLIEVQPNRVILAEAEYDQVNMQEFFIALSDKIQPNDAAFQAFKQNSSRNVVSNTPRFPSLDMDAHQRPDRDCSRHLYLGSAIIHGSLADRDTGGHQSLI